MKDVDYGQAWITRETKKCIAESCPGLLNSQENRDWPKAQKGSWISWERDREFRNRCPSCFRTTPPRPRKPARPPEPRTPPPRRQPGVRRRLDLSPGSEDMKGMRGFPQQIPPWIKIPLPPWLVKGSQADPDAFPGLSAGLTPELAGSGIPRPDAAASDIPYETMSEFPGMIPRRIPVGSNLQLGSSSSSA